MIQISLFLLLTLIISAGSAPGQGSEAVPRPESRAGQARRGAKALRKQIAKVEARIETLEKEKQKLASEYEREKRDLSIELGGLRDEETKTKKSLSEPEPDSYGRPVLERALHRIQVRIKQVTISQRDHEKKYQEKTKPRLKKLQKQIVILGRKKDSLCARLPRKRPRPKKQALGKKKPGPKPLAPRSSTSGAGKPSKTVPAPEEIAKPLPPPQKEPEEEEEKIALSVNVPPIPEGLNARAALLFEEVWQDVCHFAADPMTGAVDFETALATASEIFLALFKSQTAVTRAQATVGHVFEASRCAYVSGPIFFAPWVLAREPLKQIKRIFTGRWAGAQPGWAGVRERWREDAIAGRWARTLPGASKWIGPAWKIFWRDPALADRFQTWKTASQLPTYELIMNVERLKETNPNDPRIQIYKQVLKNRGVSAH